MQRGTSDGVELVAFADTGYTRKATDGRSVSGDVVMCAGACMCWFSRTQNVLHSLSTTEVEYVATVKTTKEAMFSGYYSYCVVCVWSYIF